MRTWLRAIANWFKRRKQKREYAAYFSKKFLEHHINTLELYDPTYCAEIPKNPETLKRIFPK